MAKILQAKANLQQERYTIVKSLSNNEYSAVYLAKDNQEKYKNCIIKEIYSNSNLSDDQQIKRSNDFNECMMILIQLDHPNLTNVTDSFIENGNYYAVMERIEGLTLKNMMEMSIKALPEKQVLNWGIQICSAIQHLHDRPKPFIFDALNSENIMVDENDCIKLINFGLDRFFVEDNVVSFSTSPALICKELQDFAKTIAYLLTGKQVTELGITGEENISAPMSKLLNKLLSADNGGIKSFRQLDQELELIKNPPKVPAQKSKKLTPDFNLIDFNKLWSNLIERFMKQPIWLIGCEFLGIIALCLVLYLFLNPPIVQRSVPAAYIACGNELQAYSLETKKLLCRSKLPAPISSVVASRDGMRLFCAMESNGHIAVFNAKSNRLIGTFPIGNFPSKIVLDAFERWLYVLHSTEGLVTAVRLSGEPLPELPNPKAIKETATGIYSVGKDSLGIATFKAVENKGSNEAKDMVICSSSAGNSVDIFSNPPIEAIESQYCRSAGPIAITSDGSIALVGQTASSQIEIFRLPNLKGQGSITQTSGSGMFQLIVTPDDKEVWCINSSGSLGVIDLATKRLIGQIKLEGQPKEAVWNGKGSEPELLVITVNPNKLLVIKPDTKICSSSIDIGGAPNSICLVNAPTLSSEPSREDN